MINWIGVIQETLMITIFVIIMMLLIEFVNVISKGSLVKLLNKSSYLQIIAGALLGIIPGCMGTFAVVSLYSQKLLSFGALIATMIATSGDEAFFMLAFIPKEAITLFIIMFVIAVFSGILVDKFFKNKRFLTENKIMNFVDEHDHNHDCAAKASKIISFKNFDFNRYRIYLSTIIVGVIILAFTGWIGHSHFETVFIGNMDIQAVEHNHDCEHSLHEHEHSHDCEHEHDYNCDHSMHIHGHGDFDLVKVIIVVCAVLVLFIILFCDGHFAKEHLWKHVIKKHLPKIFLWVFGTLLVINFIMSFADLNSLIYKNLYIVLLVALLIGIIPQSGPHLIFVVLFIQGFIPFSILLANSIVQDGHGALPLLAEARKSFLVMKVISICIGFVFGIVGLLIGF
jgi:hypothetical protein